MPSPPMKRKHADPSNMATPDDEDADQQSKRPRVEVEEPLKFARDLMNMHINESSFPREVRAGWFAKGGNSFSKIRVFGIVIDENEERVRLHPLDHLADRCPPVQRWRIPAKVVRINGHMMAKQTLHDLALEAIPETKLRLNISSLRNGLSSVYEEVVEGVNVVTVGVVFLGTFTSKQKDTTVGIPKNKFDRMSEDEFEPKILRQCIVDGYAMLEELCKERPEAG